MDFNKLQKIAQDIANKKPEGSSKKVGEMELNDMFQHVTKNFMEMMQKGELDPSNFIDTSQMKSRKNVKDITDDVEEQGSEDGEDDDGLLPKTKNLNYDLSVTLKELYTGKKKKVSIKRKRCNVFKEDGGKERVKYTVEKKKLSIPIIPGMEDQHTIRFEGLADEKQGHRAGDVVIKICEEPDDTFERNGDNLLMVKDISLSEAFGLKFSFTHLDGTEICVESRKGDAIHTKNGVRKLKGLGMPIYGDDSEAQKHGDLYIKFNLVTPENVDPKHINTLKEIFPPLNESNTEDNKCVLEDLTETDYNTLYDYGEFDDDEEEDSDDSSEEDEDEDGDGEEDDEDEDN